MQTWPIFVALMFGRRGSSFDTFELALAGLGIVGVVPSIISYYKFYFHLSDAELIINSGILKKVKLSIPFERIQSVNFKQTFLHQFFKVTSVEIETAGSSKQETNIDALSIDLAEQLRSRILELKRSSGKDEITEDELSQVEDEQREVILELSNEQLIRVGLVQNHLKPIGLIAGVVGSFFFYSYTFDIDPRDIFNQVYSYGEQLSLVHILILMAFIAIAAIAFSVISTFLTFYQLKFWRIQEKFQVVQGLLTRREFAAMDKKIQILNWGQNPIERAFGFYNIMFRQALSGEESKKTGRFKIPGCREEQVAFVQSAWMGPESGKFENYKTVSIHLFLHTFFYQVIIFPLIIAVMVYFGLLWQPVLISVVFLGTIILNWLHYSKKRFACNDKEIYVGGGTLGLRHSILPIYKVQNVAISENPYQWRRGLSTLLIYTAAGVVSIPYIPKKEAIALMDFLVYKVENSNKSWI